MTKEQEAQTITPQQFHEAMQFVWELLPNRRACQIKGFVDSQAQTIATNAAYAIELQGKISEQEKEIERLKEIEEKWENHNCA